MSTRLQDLAMRRTNRLLRISQRLKDTPIQTTLPIRIANHGSRWGSVRQITSAKAASLRQPSDAPAASMLDAVRPRLVPSYTMRCFCCCSCFSIRLALAEKMAGNARKRPPISGPKRRARMPAVTMQTPPNMKRIANQWNLIPLSAASFADTIMSIRSVLREKNSP